MTPNSDPDVTWHRNSGTTAAVRQKQQREIDLISTLLADVTQKMNELTQRLPFSWLATSIFSNRMRSKESPFIDWRFVFPDFGGSSADFPKIGFCVS